VLARDDGVVGCEEVVLILKNCVGGGLDVDHVVAATSPRTDQTSEQCCTVCIEESADSVW
jgi:phosphohistidine phosphatase SixA